MNNLFELQEDKPKESRLAQIKAYCTKPLFFKDHLLFYCSVCGNPLKLNEYNKETCSNRCKKEARLWSAKKYRAKVSRPKAKTFLIKKIKKKYYLKAAPT